MIVVWIAMNCLSEYLKLKEEGRLERPDRPERCLERQCRQRKSYWRHGSYERTVVEASLAGKIIVERFKCKACGKTVSVLPLFVVPRRRFSGPVMAERVEGYCIAKNTSYRREANGPPKEPCTSPAQLWRWVELLARRAKELLIDVQAACIRCDCDEESLIRADRAEIVTGLESRELKCRLGQFSLFDTFGSGLRG